MHHNLPEAPFGWSVVAAIEKLLFSYLLCFDALFMVTSKMSLPPPSLARSRYLLLALCSLTSPKLSPISQINKRQVTSLATLFPFSSFMGFFLKLCTWVYTQQGYSHFPLTLTSRYGVNICFHINIIEALQQWCLRLL